MTPCPIKRLLTLLMSVFLTISCLGCGSSAILAGGGMGGSGIISKGVILAFGSIVVNGTEFDTSNAFVIVDGEEKGVGDEAVHHHLDLGKYVTVIGSGSEDENNAVAEKVIYNSNLEGPVERITDIDEGTKELVVMGQTVRANSLTKFKDTDLESISIDDLIEISGMLDDSGVIWATFIEKTNGFVPGVTVEVTGFVENLDTDRQTFNIKDLIVDFSLADTESLSGGVLTEGLYVEAEGRVESVGEKLQAMKIELADELEIKDTDKIEVMGFVTHVLSEFEFKVGNQAVQIDDAVLFIDGEPEDVVPGVKLEAEGMLVNGILHAWEIEFWEPDQIEVEGIVTNILSVFEFNLGNQVVYTDENTYFEDGTLNDLSLGKILEIKGKIINGILVADKVSFEPV